MFEQRRGKQSAPAHNWLPTSGRSWSLVHQAGSQSVSSNTAEDRRPPPVPLPVPHSMGTLSTLVDQLSIDIPAGAFDGEVAWWSRLTGWRRREGIRPEFAFLDRPPGLPLRLLFQRLPGRTIDEAATAHLDLACTDRPAEVHRHLELGATALRHTAWWDTMIDPVGRPYITDRDPISGRLAQ